MEDIRKNMTCQKNMDRFCMNLRPMFFLPQAGQLRLQFDDLEMNDEQGAPDDLLIA